MRRLEIIFDIVKELEAVETLEYLNKNWLHHGVDTAKHSRAKLERFRDLLHLLKQEKVLNSINEKK